MRYYAIFKESLSQNRRTDCTGEVSDLLEQIDVPGQCFQFAFAFNFGLEWNGHSTRDVISLINLRHLPQPPEFGIVVVEDPGESDVKKHNKKPLPFLKKCFHFVLKMIYFGNASQE